MSNSICKSKLIKLTITISKNVSVFNFIVMPIKLINDNKSLILIG